MSVPTSAAQLTQPGPVATGVWLLVFVATLLWSAIRPHDHLTWALEVAPAVVALIVLALTRRSFPLTPLVYWLILAHAVVLIVGGHYTYARVPPFDWLRDALDLSRNHYDRLGHFMQGFVPAMVAREVLLRRSPIGHGPWLPFLVGCFTLSVSALYELIEWGVALLSDEGAESFLGTQGDHWDTQADMFMCLVGTLVALACLSRLHDRQLQR